jgi:hypothetical protein
VQNKSLKAHASSPRVKKSQILFVVRYVEAHSLIKVKKTAKSRYVYEF